MNNKKILDFQTIAVDFDGTLCYSKWPELGQPNQALIEYLQEWKRNGNKLILWTCRAGEALSKTQRHRTRNGAMPLCLFCNIQFYFCCLGKFFFLSNSSFFSCSDRQLKISS